MMDWSAYWILEVLAPGYILLGFALAAAVIGGVFFVGGGLGDYLATSLPITLVAFGAMALVIWLALRQIFKSPKGSVKVWDTDINDN
jgi:membrane protein implicated in regulation of membrane protease activity